ncbi:MAG: aminodeoxychorismate/anthranilate synthase component II [Spirochaetia bacterium]|nr:aminodeoxychorismate/anthranilate synthase component II [Spirochaetia bacterium]
MKVLIIDNYDSFTYNLYQYIGEILSDGVKSFKLDVIRNDEKKYDWIEKKKYDKIIISPGPGHPEDPAYFGVCSRVIQELGRHTHLLGVCLGMQGIAGAFGGKIIRAEVPMHGKLSPVHHDGKGIFQNLPDGIEVMRYHSLIADPGSLPESLEITARTFFENSKSFEIMGLRHKTLPIEGVQFHPESFGTEGGKQMLRNFLFA